MIGSATLANPPARPSREHAQVCLACTEGDHEQVLLGERCPCPCHGARRDSEVAA